MFVAKGGGTWQHSCIVFMPCWKFEYTSSNSTLVKVGGGMGQSPATKVIHLRLSQHNFRCMYNIHQ